MSHLQRLLDWAEISLNDDPDGHLPWPVRIRIWQSLEYDHREDAHVRRAIVGIREAKGLVPEWSSLPLTAVAKELPEKFLSLACAHVRNQLTANDTRDRIMDIYGLVSESIAEHMELGGSGEPVLAAQAACCWALAETIWDEDLYPGVLNDGWTEFDVSVEDCEVDYLCSVAVAGDVPGNSKESIAPRRMFWHRMLTERIPYVSSHELPWLLEHI